MGKLDESGEGLFFGFSRFGPSAGAAGLIDSSRCLFFEAESLEDRASHLRLYSSALTLAICRSLVFSESSANRNSEAEVASDSSSSCAFRG